MEGNGLSSRKQRGAEEAWKESEKKGGGDRRGLEGRRGERGLTESKRGEGIGKAYAGHHKKELRIASKICLT